MKKIETIEEIHAILLDIAKEFHRICMKNDIPYYMLGGTQLGAVRHKGFIPWDDDMDFGIPREHYERFQELASKELPEQYTLLTIKNSKRIITELSKIELNTTIIEEEFARDPQKQIGIFIDIFPLDKTNGDQGVLSKNNIIRYITDIIGYKSLSMHKRPFFRKIVAVMIKIALAPFSPQLAMSFIKNRLILKDGDYIVNHYGAWKTKEVMPKAFFGSPKLYCFEDTYFWGIENYEDYLEHIYGDWRQLPPESKKRMHLLNVYYK